VIERKKEMDVFVDFWVQGTKDPEIQAKIQRLYERWREDIKAVVDEGVQCGLFSPGSAHLVPALLVSLMEGAELQYRIDGDAFDLEEYFGAAYEMVLNLLLRPPTP
jgi:hypothetical protein